MSDTQSIDTPENWSKASSGYAEKIAPYMMATFAEEFVNRLDVSKEHNTLEVACGSGAITTELAKNAKSLLATDFSEMMIEYAKKKVEMAGLNNVSFKVMDGMDLQLQDNSFDRAACCFGLMLFPDRHKGFTELNRVLRPGGKSLVTGWGGMEKFEAFGLFMKGIARAFPDFPKPEKTPPVFTLSNLDDFKQQMEAAGFKNVSTDYVSRELELKNFEDMWGMLTTGAPPIKMLFKKIGSAGVNKVKESLYEIVKETYGDGTIRVNNTATIGVGTAS